MTATGQPHFEIRYSKANPNRKLWGWYYVLVASNGKESHESNVFFDDGVFHASSGKPEGEYLCEFNASEELKRKKDKIEENKDK